jgi:lsr operon transcriptional repressor
MPLASENRSGVGGGGREEGRETLVRVAWYYYKDNLTQAEIAGRLSVSRATVARMIQRAKDVGIVRIDINADDLATFELSRRLCDTFGLDDALVVPGLAAEAGYAQRNERIAQAAVQYLRRFLRPGATIGIGWGDTVLRTLFALSRESLKGVSIVTIAGGIDAYTRKVMGASRNGLVEHIRFLPAPLLASTPEAATAMRQDASVTTVLSLASSADATLIGIGSSRQTATILEHGVITEAQLDLYREHGAVGDMLAEWYDEQGNVLAAEMQQLRVGIPIEQLRELPNVIAVAGGMEKVKAIAGALAGRYLDVLVTTEDVAEALLADR